MARLISWQVQNDKTEGLPLFQHCLDIAIKEIKWPSRLLHKIFPFGGWGVILVYFGQPANYNHLCAIYFISCCYISNFMEGGGGGGGEREDFI